jgi:hypothetical protein
MSSSVVRIVLLSGILMLTSLCLASFGLSPQSGGDSNVGFQEWEVYTDSAGNPLYVPESVDPNDEAAIASFFPPSSCYDSHINAAAACTGSKGCLRPPKLDFYADLA